jgi:uncharacterized sporulation protein YeaH/YhbH (DUF444 family)
MTTTPGTWWKTGAVGLAGLAAGGVLATTFSATAEDSGNGSGDSAGQTDDRSQLQRGDEEALTGGTADKVREAALAKYPGATVLRLETDSGGVYEAHLLKADGTPVTVLVGEDFQVTGEEEGGFGHGFGDEDGGSDDGATQSSSTI